MIDLGRIYTVSRTIHRIFVVLALTGTILVGGTGVIMRSDGALAWLPVDPLTIRRVHNLFSGWFFAVLAVMGLTGMVMYVYPWYMRRIRK